MPMPNDLLPYAVNQSNTKSRSCAEDKHSYRDAFERDRDRIMHSSAFRMLEGKTQVFTPGVNDHYRTRLTHSIEVAQIGRTIARAIGVNESLTEAICLGHDLGHSPFGHAGEHTLNELMKEHGGFEHNRQTLRIVDLIEHPYPNFAGLNLMYETRLGFARHRSPYDKPQADEFAEKQCSLEGQITDVADRIAYNCHDLEDGMRAGLISEEELCEIELFRIAQEMISAGSIEEASIRKTRTAKKIIDFLVSDCLNTSKGLIDSERIGSLDDVYNADKPLISLSDDARRQIEELEETLLNNMYLHPELKNSAKKTEQWLTKLFESCCKNPDSMPGSYKKLIPEFGVERSVCDYIAGMTDRFCESVLDGI